MDQTNSLEQQARNVYNKRRTALLNNASDQIIKFLQEIPILERTEQLINNIHTKPPFLQVFLLNLIIAATRVWEAFNKDEEGNYCFPIWTTQSKRPKLSNMILMDFSRMYTGLDEDNPIQITLIDDSQRKSLLIKVQSQLLENIETIKKILNEEVM